MSTKILGDSIKEKNKRMRNTKADSIKGLPLRQEITEE